MMQWTRTVSDDNVIDRVRRFQRHRRKIATFMVVAGILSLVAGISCILWIQREWESTGSTLMADPTQADIVAAVDDTTFILGVSVGYTCAASILCGLLAAVHGLGMFLWRDRRNELLLEFWDSKSECPDTRDLAGRGPA